MLVSAWGETWNHWIVSSRLGLPIRAELSSMVFTKSMRRKDVKGLQKQKEKESLRTSPVLIEGIQIPSPLADSVEDSTEEAIQKSRQGTINLVVRSYLLDQTNARLKILQGVDARLISSFATFSYIFPLTITKMVVSVVFLLQLIGWKSLLSGFIIFIIVLPINVIISKKFTEAQANLMKLRDKKTRCCHRSFARYPSNQIQRTRAELGRKKLARQEPRSWQTSGKFSNSTLL